MARAMYRKAMWFRVATLCLALVFVIGFTGIGAAVPRADADQGEKIEAGDTSPPLVGDAEGKAPAPLDPDKQDEDATESVPADLGAVEESAAPEPIAVEPAVELAVMEPVEVRPAVEDIQVIPALSPLPAEAADLNSNLMGWNSETGSWTNGNLGKYYNEGDWVTYRITIENLRSEPKSLPAFGIEYDYYRSATPGQIGVDKTKEWTFYTGSGDIVPTGPLPGDSITPTSDDDALMPGTIPGDTNARHVVRFDTSVSHTLIVPADGTVIIYFRAHLSITAWWQQNAGLNGIGSYPGSSAQLAMNGVGAQTVPIPVPPAPDATIKCLKFYDEVNDGGLRGTYEGEPGLEGWDFTLSGGSDGFFYTLHDTSDADGEFGFGPLPPGTYSLTEAISAPWATAYTFPMTVVIPASSSASVSTAVKPPGPVVVCVKVGNYVDAHPEITVTKTPSSTKMVTGDSVTYAYLVTNTGDVPLQNIAAVDDKLDITGVSIPDLDVGESYPFSKTTTLADTTTNVVEVTADDEYGHTVEDTDTATVVVIDPSVSILKTVNHEHILVGESVTYKYVVKNTGDAPLTGIAVADDKLGSIGFTPGLASSESATFSIDATISVDTSNEATVTAYDEFGNAYSDTDTAMVWVHDPGISIVKSAVPIVIIPGELVQYTYLVTNTGDMDLRNITVTDDKITTVIGTLAFLPVGDFIAFTATVPVDEDTTNVGRAVGEYSVPGTDFGGFVEDTDDAFVDVVHPAISIVKTASADLVVTGSTVTYTYKVTNTGDVPLQNITALDDKLDITGTAIPDLAVDESFTVTAQGTLTETTTNTVGVTGYDSEGHPASARDMATVKVIDPSVSIVKTVDQPHILVGGAVEYTYVVTNDGDAPLYEIEVTDNKLGTIGTAVGLASSESTTFAMVANISVDTLNVATVTAQDELGNPYSDADEAMVTVHNPDISIVKSASPGTILAGASVLYTYQVVNTGDITLSEIAISDDMLGAIGVIPMLAPDATATVSTAAPISVDTTNVATAVGWYGSLDSGFFGSVTDNDDAFVDVVAPAIEIVKTASAPKVVTGTLVTYTYTVTNTGDVPLSGITAVDDKIDITSEAIPDLDVGDDYTFQFTDTLTATTTNIAEASGFDESGHEVSDSDDATVEVIDPSVSIVKTVDQPHILVGGAVEYTYVVTNDGDAPLYEIEVTDNKLGTIGTAVGLASSESTTFAMVANISVDTLNVATVTAQDEFDNPYSDFDEAEVAVHAPGISIVKSADPTVIIAGELVEYSYLVTNTGDMDLFDVAVTDNLLGAVGIIDFLPIGMADTVSVTVQIDEDTVNIGTAVGHYEIPDTPFGGVVDDDSSAAVDVVNPAISVTKTASESMILTGSSVTYTYTIENVGDVLLVDIVAADDKLDISGTVIPDLAVGQDFTFSVPTELTETTTNTVDVSGYDEAGHMVSASATETVRVIDPAIGIVKTANPTVILAGETVTYTYVVTNEGDYPLHSMAVEDDMLGPIGFGPSIFMPGATETFIVTASVNVDTTNVATVTAGYGVIDDEAGMAGDGWLEASDDAVVDVVNPAISVVKSSDVPEDEGIEVGADTPVTYTYVVTNTGDVTLFDTALTDDKLGDIADIGTLAVGESETIDVTVILNPPTADAITNVATVTAVDEYEHPVSDEDTHTVGTFDPFTPPDMQIVKTADKTVADPGDIITYTLTWTNVGEGVSGDFTIIDDFDDTYLTVVNSGGGTVSGDTITWKRGPAAPGATGSVSYTLQVASTMPTGTTNLDNVAVIIEPDDVNPDNDRDTWRVKVTVGEPFLPFTGGQLGLLLLAGFGLGLLGIMLRRLAILGRTA